MTETNNTLSIQDAPAKTTHEYDLSAAKGIFTGVLLGVVCWFALIGLFLVLS